MELSKAKRLLNKVKPDLQQFQNLDEIIHNYSDANESFEAAQISKIGDKLAEALYLYNNLCKPVKAEGTLVKRSDERYEIANTDYYFTSGSTVEVYLEDRNRYYLTTIEHNGDDYFAVVLPKLSLEGMKVRIR